MLRPLGVVITNLPRAHVEHVEAKVPPSSFGKHCQAPAHVRVRPWFIDDSSASSAVVAATYSCRCSGKCALLARRAVAGGLSTQRVGLSYAAKQQADHVERDGNDVMVHLAYSTATSLAFRTEWEQPHL